MDVNEFRKQGYAAIDAVCNYYETIEQNAVIAQVEPGYLVKDLPTEAPKEGEDFDVIASDFQTKIMPGISHWQHPSFFAYFPGVTNFESILADLYSASISQPGFNWLCSPAATELEMVVMDWAAKLLGLDDTFYLRSKVGGGIINTSASDSCLAAAIAAREHALRYLARVSPISSDDGLTSDVEEPVGSPLTPKIAGPADVPGKNSDGKIQAEGIDHARWKAFLEDQSVPTSVRDKYTHKLIMYGSTQTHSLGAKAALILGMHWRALPVTKEDNYSLTGKTLRAALEEDTAKGLIPFCVVATIGTTSSGTCDRVAEIGEVAKDYPTLFIHVDAAWAGVYLSLPEQRDYLQLPGINTYAHSFCANFHKSGLVAFDCSSFFVRDRELLTKALDVTPFYLRTKQGDAGTVIDYRNWQISLGRRFRSLKLWMVLRSYGVDGFQKHLRGGVSQAKSLAARIDASPNFEIVAPPSLALVVFRLKPPSTPTSKLNALNKRLIDALSARTDLAVTQTMLPAAEGDVAGIYCIRMALGGVLTREEHVMNGWEAIKEEAGKILEDMGAEVVEKLKGLNLGKVGEGEGSEDSPVTSVASSTMLE